MQFGVSYLNTMNIETKIEELRKEFNSKLDEILKAEIVKTKTIDKICIELSYLTLADVTRYLTENKQDIINALNNL